MKWLIYGHKGWIGSYFCNYVKQKFSDVELVYPTSRADNIQNVSEDLDQINPDRVISFIGRTSGPGFNTIDYLEQKGKLIENIRDNLFSPIILMEQCELRNIHCTYLGTGCIFSYKFPDDPPFTETSEPNFKGSRYSFIKGITDQLTKEFSNVLNVRIRMPIVEYDCTKNFISKIIRYPLICNTLNSMTVLPDAIPALVKCILDSRVGTINLVNPEPIDHNIILELYKKYVNHNHTWKNMTEEEQDKMLLGQRSKNVLVPSFDLPKTKDSVERIFLSGKFNKPDN